jgi:triosephosphate isomerase
MKKQSRKVVIAGNWKMNKTRPDASALAKQLADVAENPDVEVVVCVPFTSLETVINEFRLAAVKVGAQNVHFEKSGAFTGEVSADMLKELGVQYVVIGHSERRQYFGETDATVNARTKAALNAGLIPLMCIGELLEEREAGITEEVLSRQTKLAFAGFTADEVRKTVIAYEPVWAIGTGKTATAEQAGEACGFIRGVVAKLYGAEVADAVTIQYGGSMNAKNAAELLAQEDVDGGLIGGASLVAEDFKAIITAAAEG